MKRIISLGLAAAVLVSGVAMSAPAKNEAEAKTAIEARSNHFKEIEKVWKPVAEMLRRAQPYDAAVVEKNSAQVVELSKKIPSLYEVDTRQFPAIKTQALDGIWSSQADFKGKADELTKAATALNEVAKGGGDAAAFTKAAAATGKACGSCHDSYRQKKT